MIWKFVFVRAVHAGKYRNSYSSLYLFRDCLFQHLFSQLFVNSVITSVFVVDSLWHITETSNTRFLPVCFVILGFIHIKYLLFSILCIVSYCVLYVWCWKIFQWNFTVLAAMCSIKYIVYRKLLFFCPYIHWNPYLKNLWRHNLSFN
jgi:hypothetical protein